ncbi:hypothetical protein VTK73DRAFT_10387 [Phialemonium thermophilum]|uniref:non-specific serine/threonine protein kinase n=1 Tax=Phialemonium thermophilum TaxID=223376 RepID=A0ABR3VWX0_9PEZI
MLVATLLLRPSSGTTGDGGGASPARPLPAAQPELHGDDVLLEEETLSWFHPGRWYPVRIGDVIRSRYQVLVKLGFGSVSTVWLCRDLRRHRYVSLKIYETGHRQASNETVVLHHLTSLVRDGKGSRLVRTSYGDFEIPGLVGPHVCLVYDPLCMTLEDLREYSGGKLPTYALKPLLQVVLRGLDYLHTVAHVVHTDIQANNIMLSTQEANFWDELVEEEWTSPSPRKVVGDRVIYESKDVDIPDDGMPVICDFGEAKVGDGPFIGEVMPDLYRAPEIILYIPWNEKIDIWGFGLMVWDLLEGKHLFNKRLPSRDASRGAHMARIVTLLGNPPPDFLKRSVASVEFFDEQGNPKEELRSLNTGGSLEEEEEALEGEDGELFLAFLRRTLQWRPEDRPTARELLDDPWLKSTEAEEDVRGDARQTS